MSEQSEGKRFSNQEDEEDSANFEYVIREAYGEILVNISSIRDTMKRRTSQGEKNNKKENISLLPKGENQVLPADRPEECWTMADTKTKTGTEESRELGQPKTYSIASRLQSFEDSSSFNGQNARIKSGKTSWTNEIKDVTGKASEKRSKKSSHSKHERAIRKALAQMRMQDFNPETEGGNADGGTEKLICKTVRIKNDILYVVKGDV